MVTKRKKEKRKKPRKSRKLRKRYFGAEKRKREEEETEEEPEQKKSFYERHKKKIQIAAGVVTTAAVIAGGIYLHKNYKKGKTGTKAIDNEISSAEKRRQEDLKDLKNSIKGKTLTPEEELAHRREIRATEDQHEKDRELEARAKREQKMEEERDKQRTLDEKKNSAFSGRNLAGMALAGATGNMSIINTGDPIQDATMQGLVGAAGPLIKDKITKALAGKEEEEELEKEVDGEPDPDERKKKLEKLERKKKDNQELHSEINEHLEKHAIENTVEDNIKNMEEQLKELEKDPEKNAAKIENLQKSIENIKKHTDSMNNVVAQAAEKIEKIEKIENKEAAAAAAAFGKRKKKNIQKIAKQKGIKLTYTRNGKRYYKSLKVLEKSKKSKKSKRSKKGKRSSFGNTRLKKYYTYTKQKVIYVSKVIANGILTGIGFFTGITISIIALLKFMQYRKVQFDPMFIVKLFKATDKRGNLHVEKFIRLLGIYSEKLVTQIALKIRKELPELVQDATTAGLGIVQQNAGMLMMPMMMALNSYFTKQMEELTTAAANKKVVVIKKRKSVSKSVKKVVPKVSKSDAAKRAYAKKISKELINDIISKAQLQSEHRRAATKIQAFVRGNISRRRTRKYKQHLLEHTQLDHGKVRKELRLHPWYVKTRSQNEYNRNKSKFGKKKR